MIKTIVVASVLAIKIPMMPIVPSFKVQLSKPLPRLQLSLPLSAIPQVTLRVSSSKETPKPVQASKPVQVKATKVTKVKAVKKVKEEKEEAEDDEEFEKWLDEFFDGREREGRYFLPEDELIRDIGVPKD